MTPSLSFYTSITIWVMMGGTTWTDIPSSPEQWIGDRKRIKSFFNTWRRGTPRAKVMLLYGNPGCGKTSSVYAFREDDSIIHRNCSSDGGIRKMDEIYELVQSPTDIDGNRVILLLDEIEGLTHKSMELMKKIIKTTKIPVVMTCNMDRDEVSNKIWKYKWGRDIDVFEIKYPENDVVDRLNQLWQERGEEIKRETLERIASACNSVRSAILTLHRFLEKGKLGKIIPIDIEGSEHEKIRKLLKGEREPDSMIDHNKFLSYCLSNRVSAVDVGDYAILTHMARQRRLSKIDEKFRNLLRAENDVIFFPKVKARSYFFKPKEKKQPKDKGDDSYKKSGLPGVRVQKKSGVSIDDLW